jgi:hypothetical protein
VSAATWVLAGLGLWITVAGVAGRVLGRVVVARDAQVPHDGDACSRPAIGDAFRVPRTAGTAQGEPEDLPTWSGSGHRGRRDLDQ